MAKFTEKIYAVLHNNNVVFATENQQEALTTFYRLLFSLKESVRIKTYNLENNVKEFDIIENDPEQDYGYSELYIRETDTPEKYTTMCWKHRLPFKETGSYSKAVEQLREVSAYCIDSTNVAGALNAHLDWWCQPPLSNEKAGVFFIPSGVLNKLLERGLQSERLLVSVVGGV